MPRLNIEADVEDQLIEPHAKLSYSKSQCLATPQNRGEELLTHLWLLDWTHPHNAVFSHEANGEPASSSLDEGNSGFILQVKGWMANCNTV